MKILMTGFEPFGGDTAINPSWSAVEAMQATIAGAEIVKYRLPVTYDGAGRELCRILREEQPDAVIAVGQAGGRAAVTPERVAINWMEGTVPDNAGHLCQGKPIRMAGPAAYFSTLPLRSIVEALHSAGIPAAVSNSAGTYVCNALLYALMEHLALYRPQTISGFIHVPFTPEQAAARPAGTPSMTLPLTVRALEIAAAATAAALGTQR